MKRFLASALAGLFLAFSVQQACATVLFAGGEDVDGTSIGTVTIDTTAGHFRTGYARAALAITGTAVDPPTYRFVLPTFANQSIVWVHTENSNNNATTSGAQLLGVYGSDGVRRLLVRGTGTNGQVKISTRNTAGTITDLVTCTSGSFPVNGTLTKLDMYVDYAVSGEVTLYVNGVQFCDYQGDVTTNSVTAVNDVDFANVSGNTSDWSEIIVATTDTRSMNLMTCAPQANGTNMAWSGSYANVNPTTINDASVISSGTSSQVAEFTCPALPTGTFTVPAVTQTVRGVAGTSGPQSFDFVARPSSGSTDYPANNTAFTSVFGNYYNVWSQNPACSCGWTTNDVTTGVNFGLESEP